MNSPGNHAEPILTAVMKHQVSGWHFLSTGNHGGFAGGNQQADRLIAALVYHQGRASALIAYLAHSGNVVRKIVGWYGLGDGQAEFEGDLAGEPRRHHFRRAGSEAEGHLSV